MTKTSAARAILLEPYRVSGRWVFDFPPAGWVAQPFARGIPEILEVVLRRKGLHGVKRFRLTFSDVQFPEWDGELKLVESDPAGPRYCLVGVEGEPTGTLFLLDAFFSVPPQQLYFRVERIDQ